jgi:hypothetical protein
MFPSIFIGIAHAWKEREREGGREGERQREIGRER